MPHVCYCKGPLSFRPKLNNTFVYCLNSKVHPGEKGHFKIKIPNRVWLIWLHPYNYWPHYILAFIMHITYWHCIAFFYGHLAQW
jgi:hypothetical protein